MPLDHVGYGCVSDLATSRAWYEKALAPLRYKVVMDYSPQAVGFGVSVYKPDFWLATTKPQVTTSMHVAFKGTRAQVHAFHEAGIQAGGKCNGPPGFRTDYHPFYYGAFVIDPDGNNIEVVNHGSAWQWFWYFVGTTLGFIDCKGKKQD
ncbi:Glyoxalase/bleomycin resistance protein/dioxygenase [Ceratobasidium theobromae]|uniref:Glyoxalase/bleomycin resistance protein/dioxygenase n=1 Tax=Ceratobasidium theobromae TaxID=1582974 RepID=A0A5N5QE49_9AGAM|nr:Glyoxalase/bleomycin resistance protein/dioxygenase [Ceratobasidium theobromae]